MNIAGTVEVICQDNMHLACIFLWLLAYVHHVTTQDGNDCPYKECECSGTYIECQERGLSSMPICYNSDATGYLTLTLDSNKITEIPAGSLPSGLTEISLIGNPITTIDEHAFDQLSTTLESLYFENAQLARIPDAFLHLDSLQHLNIMSTRVLDWNVGAMVHIGETLQTLNIVDVGLTTWPVWLNQFTQLNELNIAQGSISSIPDNAFDKLSTILGTLTLNNNDLSSAPKSLCALKNLLSLDLQGNKISNITWLPQSGKLYDMYLNNNRISDASHLSSVLRSYASSLVILTLSFNQLTAIPDLSFLTNIESFDLSHNLISDPGSGAAHSAVYDFDLSSNLLPSIPTIFRSLKSLSTLSLSHNIIRVVQSDNIPSWVTNIDLSYNFIMELTDTSFPDSSFLQELILNNNPLNHISNLAFKNLGDLSNLSIQNTKLTRVPLSLNYLTRIRYLDLSNNPDLVCTCMEKSVKDKITSDIDVSGYCGFISIYDFMANLSPNCP